ncbi:phage tail assembly chaperone [Tsuneonella amylolytica]|uniref:phage tail assembly chaperone n=1 Tax=Tsuneonella amylolytica TaxID=2338327 RepID=UPI001F1B63F7|nr:phage tail assembly chaperone [Tsuneonella amylolytica]
MSGTDIFGAAALTLSALAARALGWRPGEFWSATPAELAACLADPAAPPPPLGRADLARLMEMDSGGGPDGHG